MAGFAGASLHLGQEFLFFSSDKNSFPLISFLCKWSIGVSSVFSQTPSSLRFPPRQWEWTSELSRYIHSDSFIHHCISPFHISRLPSLLPNLTPPKTPCQLLTPLHPSLFPRSFPPALPQLGEVLCSLGLVLFVALKHLSTRTKVRSWSGLHWLLWNITDISLLFQLTGQLIMKSQRMICN